MTAQSGELRPHPTSPCDAIRRFAVAIEPAALPGEIGIRYRIEGEIGRLRLAATGNARRSDGLWQHSCFEAFLRTDASDTYYEFNFAPSGDWAAYRFGGRRSDRVSPELPAPRIEFRQFPDACELNAVIAIAALPELAGATPVHAGLSAVVEQRNGGLSWWALAHAGDKPDFHDPSTFVLRVTAP